MSSDIAGSIILLAVLLLFSVYFSATETSITAAGKGKLLALSDEYPHRKKGFQWLVDNTAQAINVTLIGNNLVNIGASAVATSVSITLFGAVGPALAVAVMTSAYSCILRNSSQKRRNSKKRECASLQSAVYDVPELYHDTVSLLFLLSY